MRKIKKGDEVLVISGKDKGKKGAVQAILQGGKTLLVEGINTVKKHMKADPNKGERGGVVIKIHPIQRSNVMLCDASTGKGSRVGIKILADGRKVRYLKSTDQQVDV